MSVPESGGNKIIPAGITKPGEAYAAAATESGKIGVYKFEVQVVSGSGKYEKSGTGSNSRQRVHKNSFQLLQGQCKIHKPEHLVKEKDYFFMSKTFMELACPELRSCSLRQPLLRSIGKVAFRTRPAILGSMTIGGSVGVLENLAGLLQVCLDAGAKRVMIPISSAGKIATVPPDLFSKFQISFYEDPIDAVYKSMAFI